MATRRSGLIWTVLASIFGLGTTLLRYASEQVLGDFVAGRTTDVLGAWTGVEEAQVIGVVATWLLPAAIIAGAMGLTAVILRWHGAAKEPELVPLRRERSFVCGNSPPGAPSDTDAGPLEFAFGEDKRFSEHEHKASGTVRRTVRVAVVNKSGAELNDCRVHLERITPEREIRGVPFERVPLNLEGFPLRPGGLKMVDVAAYDDVLPDRTRSPHIVVSTPESPFQDFFQVPAAKAYTLLLRATAASGVFAEATCRLFVEKGRLRLERL